MLNWLWAGIMLAALIFGAINGKIDAVTSALLSGGGEAIKLALTLGGAMCLWGGMMRIAEKGGLTTMLSRLLAPVMHVLFPGIKADSPACRAMLMNMAANFLGLGNAATPLGIKAMQELEKSNPNPGIASTSYDNLCCTQHSFDSAHSHYCSNLASAIWICGSYVNPSSRLDSVFMHSLNCSNGFQNLWNTCSVWAGKKGTGEKEGHYMMLLMKEIAVWAVPVLFSSFYWSLSQKSTRF